MASKGIGQSWRAFALLLILGGASGACAQVPFNIEPVNLEEHINDSAYLATGSSSALYNGLHTLRLGFHPYSVSGPPASGYGYEMRFYVKADTGVGIGTGPNTPGFLGGMSPSFPYWTGPTYRVTATASGPAWISLASTGSLAGATIKVVVVEVWWHTDTSQNPPQTVSSFHSHYVEYAVGKLAATATSIDTRKTFGQPNLGGELPGDANAPPAEINFYNSIYKGGLFLGNAPWQANDQSGTSRIQLWSNGVPAAKMAAALSMYQQGYNAKLPSPIEVGVYFPKSTDVNFNVAAGDVRWPTRWNVAPRASVGSPPDYSLDPYRPYAGYDAYTSRVLGSNYPPGEFVCWPLSQTGVHGDEVPTNALTNIVLAVKDEANWASGGGSGWRYFADPPYAALQTGKYADTAPKIWTVTPVNVADGETWSSTLPAWYLFALGTETSPGS